MNEDVKTVSPARVGIMEAGTTEEEKALIDLYNKSSDITRYALTTLDNPYDPFTDFQNWFMFDVEKGYNTCARLARFVDDSDELTELELNKLTENAIDEIIKYDFLGIYKKISNK